MMVLFKIIKYYFMSDCSACNRVSPSVNIWTFPSRKEEIKIVDFPILNNSYYFRILTT